MADSYYVEFADGRKATLPWGIEIEIIDGHLLGYNTDKEPRTLAVSFAPGTWNALDTLNPIGRTPRIYYWPSEDANN